MKRILQKLPFLFNGTLVIAFIIHISIIAYNIKHPDFPSVKVYSKNLQDLDEFPLSFKLCARELSNITDRYREFGYNNVWSFFQGRRRFTAGKWFGWAGHGEGNKTLASVIGGHFKKLRFRVLSSSGPNVKRKDKTRPWDRVCNGLAHHHTMPEPVKQDSLNWKSSF